MITVFRSNKAYHTLSSEKQSLYLSHVIALIHAALATLAAVFSLAYTW
jgi:hypothetical protein